MANPDEKLAALKQDLAQTRDELRVKMHLAKADARDEWEELEGKWHDFERKWDTVEDAAEDVAQDVGQALARLGAEIKSGYKRISGSR